MKTGVSDVVLVSIKKLKKRVLNLISNTWFYIATVGGRAALYIATVGARAALCAERRLLLLLLLPPRQTLCACPKKMGFM